MLDLGQIMAQGVLSNDPAKKAAGALAFTVTALKTLTEGALNPDTDPAKMLSNLVFPPQFAKGLLKELL